MRPCTPDVLNQILYLIERDKCSQAVQVWSHYRREEIQACDVCPYDEFGMQDHDCCLCLESKLRTMSLYEHGSGMLATTLQGAARKLHAYQQQCH